MPPAEADAVRALRDVLAFYRAAGVDAALGEFATDHLASEEAAPRDTADVSFASRTSRAPEVSDQERAARERPARPDAKDAATTPAPTAPPPPEAAIMAAREAARAAGSLDDLRRILDRFEGCALRVTAKTLVFADGNPQARVMFVGEAPGREEDLEGLPFVGRSGQLLDRMMAAIGLDRSGAYIANIIPWRPPGNRTPTPQESQICLPFIRRQIELADPDILVCLGGPAAQTLLGVKDGILKTRGRWFPYDTGTREIRAVATLHPAYLLRQPLQKRLAWRDFLALKKALES